MWIFFFNLGGAFLVYRLLFRDNLWILEGLFFSIASVEFSVVFIMDLFSLIFFFIVILISSIIYYFSQYYMDSEKNIKNFSVLLFFFVLSILFLIFSPNFLFLLLGWDGLGVTSYLLVVYYINYRSSVAGILTFLVNRLGDVFFFSSLAFFYLFLDWRFYENKFSFLFISFFIILTFITKRAQIPFSSWLPAAIAAPTPVSSLVHSSTLVTAGVYLLVRFSSILVIRTKVLLGVSVLTIILAGVIANLDWDLKKIIAFSTLSQLGFIICSYSCGLIFFCFFHLLTHALFKASLFICSGIVIHTGDNRQEFRNNKRFPFLIPFLSSRIIVCLLCLCGFPFSSGFFSKDLVLDGGVMGFFLFFLFFFRVILTFSYSFRFSFYLLGNKIVSRSKTFFLTDNIFYICVPILILVLSALIVGSLWVELKFGVVSMLFVSLGWKVGYWVVVFFVLVITINFLNNYLIALKKYFLRTMWYINMLVSLVFFKIIFFFSLKVLRAVDQGWLENLGAGGFYKNIVLSSFFFLQAYISFFFLFPSFFFFLI